MVIASIDGLAGPHYSTWIEFLYILLFGTPCPTFLYEAGELKDRRDVTSVAIEDCSDSQALSQSFKLGVGIPNLDGQDQGSAGLGSRLSVPPSDWSRMIGFAVSGQCRFLDSRSCFQCVWGNGGGREQLC
jgi:hypothetical protein